MGWTWQNANCITEHGLILVDPPLRQLLPSAHLLSTFPISGQLLFPISLGLSSNVSSLYFSTTLSRPRPQRFSSFPYAFTAPFVPIPHLTASNA